MSPPALGMICHFNFSLHRRRLLLLGIFWLSAANFLLAQAIAGIRTKWKNDFSQWELLDSQEKVTGSLRTRWSAGDDISEWDFTLGELSGSIKTKWKGNFEEWEVRSGNRGATISALWRGNLGEWRISDHRRQFTFRSKYGNQFGEWELRGDDGFYVFVVWENDPNEWGIEDNMEEDGYELHKLAMVFIATLVASRK